MLWNEDQLPRVKKETKPTLRGKWESVFSGRHMASVPQETQVVSVMTSQPLETKAKVRDDKGNRLLPHPIRRQNRLTARNKNPHRDQAINRKIRKTEMLRLCEISSKTQCFLTVHNIGQKASSTALENLFDTHGVHKTIDQRKIQHTIHPVFRYSKGIVPWCSLWAN